MRAASGPHAPNALFLYELSIIYDARVLRLQQIRKHVNYNVEQRTCHDSKLFLRALSRFMEAHAPYQG